MSLSKNNSYKPRKSIDRWTPESGLNDSFHRQYRTDNFPELKYHIKKSVKPKAATRSRLVFKCASEQIIRKVKVTNTLQLGNASFQLPKIVKIQNPGFAMARKVKRKLKNLNSTSTNSFENPSNHPYSPIPNKQLFALENILKKYTFSYKKIT